MRKLYAPLLFLLLLCFTSCMEKHESDMGPSKEVKPYFKGTRKINLIVDEAYDLSKTEARSIADSVSMRGDEKSLYVPESYESAAFFLDDTSGEILAVVRTDTVSENVIVNAESVADALMTLVPVYHSLPLDLKDKFEKEALTIEPYKEFIITVDAILKNKQPIFSTDPAFIAQLIELNKYILKNYLGDPDLEGGRVQKVLDDDVFSNWLTREGGATLHNQVHSYVYAEFTPTRGGPQISAIIDPNPIGSSGDSKTALSSLSIPDGCYTVNLNQSYPSVYKKNWLAVATQSTGLFLNILFGQMGDQSRNDCIASLASVIVSDLTTTMMGAANSSLKDVLIRVGDTAANLIITGITGEACVNYAVNTNMIAKAVAAQFNVFSKFVTYSTNIYAVAELTPYLIAVGLIPKVDEVDLTEIMQLYNGQLKEACVMAVKEGELKEEYGFGEKISPELKLIPQSQYAEWEKKGFKVKWIAEAGNGTVHLANINLHETRTDDDGKALVEWTLPNNKEGVATLRAEIIDKEGDHLAGSPLKYTVKVVDDSIAIYKASAVGSWTVTGHDPNNPSTTYKFELYADGTGVYPSSGTGYYKDVPISWRVYRTKEGYILKEYGWWHFAYNDDSITRHGKLNYPVTKFNVYGPPPTSSFVSQEYRKN